MIRGSLKFKGKFQKKMQLEKKMLKYKREKAKDKREGTNKLIPDVDLSIKEKVITYKAVAGSGRILTTGKTLMGRETDFVTEL